MTLKHVHNLFVRCPLNIYCNLFINTKHVLNTGIRTYLNLRWSRIWKINWDDWWAESEPSRTRTHSAIRASRDTSHVQVLLGSFFILRNSIDGLFLIFQHIDETICSINMLKMSNIFAHLLIPYIENFHTFYKLRIVMFSEVVFF